MKSLYITILIITLHLSCLSAKVHTENTKLKVNLKDSLSLIIKDKPTVLKLNNNYFIKLCTNIDKKRIVIISTNSSIQRSHDKEYDIVLIPRIHGKIIMTLYQINNGVKYKIRDFEFLVENDD